MVVLVMDPGDVSLAKLVQVVNDSMRNSAELRRVHEEAQCAIHSLLKCLEKTFVS